MGQSLGILRRLPKIIRPQEVDPYLLATRHLKMQLWVSPHDFFKYSALLAPEWTVFEGYCCVILGLVDLRGIVRWLIMKQQYDEPSYDASQIYKTKNYATITFKDSPFRGQKGRILKEIVGRHPELHLEMPGGEKIRVDLLWTDYFGEPS